MGVCLGKGSGDGIPRNDPVDTFPIKENQGLIVFVVGGPGAGKFTLAKKLAAKYGLFLISASDLLRAEVNSGSERGQKFEEIMKRGYNIPADVVVQMIEQRMITQPYANGYLIVGFPRDRKQATLFNKEVKQPSLVLNLLARKSILEERMKHRAARTERFDDRPEIVCSRLMTYFRSIAGALAPNKNVTTEIDAEKPEDEVFEFACVAIDQAKERASRTESDQ